MKTFLILLYVLVIMFTGACLGAFTYQQILIHNPDRYPIVTEK